MGTPPDLKGKHPFTKRSYKHFTQEKWIEELGKQDWTGLDNSEDVNKMVDIFNYILIFIIKA